MPADSETFRIIGMRWDRKTVRKLVMGGKMQKSSRWAPRKSWVKIDGGKSIKVSSLVEESQFARAIDELLQIAGIFPVMTIGNDLVE